MGNCQFAYSNLGLRKEILSINSTSCTRVTSSHLYRWRVIDGAVILKESNKIIGLTGLNPYLVEQPEIEWQLGVDFWNKGYATEIGKAIIETAFKNSNITKIYGMANPKNIGSISVMKKVGMTCLGIRDFRDEQHMFYEILR